MAREIPRAEKNSWTPRDREMARIRGGVQNVVCRLEKLARRARKINLDTEECERIEALARIAAVIAYGA